MVFTRLLTDDKLLESRERAEGVDDDLTHIGVTTQVELSFGDVPRIVRYSMCDITARERRHSNDCDRTSIGELHGLLVNLCKV